ncbi:MAG TPA: hypothetical protein VHX65_09920 [Pirellulales bacterium]|jgi:ribosomal protein L40E|nr:hypothetical protein [Pirellulales bacterium]
MPKALVPLDSHRLAEYAVPLPCYICHEENSCDAERCRRCAAPMALTHQSKTQKTPPRMMAVLGTSGVGKTVYLGMLLDMLSRRPERLQILSRGAFSVTLQQSVIGALARGQFPGKTPSEAERWNWVHCQLRTAAHREQIELIMPDMAGEAMLEEVDHPHMHVGIRRFLQTCAGAVLLVDAAEMDDGSPEQDHFAMKVLSYLNELQDEGQMAWSGRPVAVVLSKADQCESCFEDPADFAHKRAAGLWRHCVERFPRHRFFAAGVAGACATVEIRRGNQIVVPLRIEPRGIVEPFEWLVQQIEA